MRDSVREAWHAFSTPFEGRVHSMYVDVLGLVTTGVGNLIDSPAEAAKLPWRMLDGSRATSDEIHKQWRALKAQSEFLKKRHWKYAADVTTIRLSDDDIDALVADKLAANHAYMRRWFPGLDDVPADAQLAIHSLAWAAGPGFNQKFPNWTRQALAGRWDECAVSGQLRATGPDGTPNPGVIPRNRANKLCFENAAFVTEHDIDRSQLFWPARAADTIVMPPKPEDPPPLETPEQFGTLQAQAMAAAEDSRFANLERLRADAMREMSGLESEPPVEGEPEFLPREAITKTDRPKGDS
jgi:GH24 family phage-related lysozyme (muramidase)